MTLTNDAPAQDHTMEAAKDLCVGRCDHGRRTARRVRGARPPEAYNRESNDEPPATCGRGPEAFYATALWLRSAFDELAFEVHDVVAEGDLVVIHNTMSGRHTGVFTIYGPNGEITQAMPPTGKRFATTQTHWMRVKDGKVIEHWANRDDQGTAMQLGWVPPSPWYLLKMALATRLARRCSAATQATSPG